MKIPLLAVLLIAVLALVIAGVNSAGTIAAPPPVSTPPPTSAIPAGVPSVAEIGSPVAALQAVSDGLRENRPVVLWNALPASRQADVTSLLAGCALQLEGEAWSQAFGAIEALGVVLDTRPELVRGSLIATNLLAMSSEDRSAEPWFRLGPLLTEIGQSPLRDVDQLATLDVAQLLEQQGRTFSAALPDLSQATRGSLDALVATRDRIAAMQSTVLQQDDQRALLRLETPGRPAKDMWFAQRDGKWIPEALDREWVPRLAETRERCASLATTGELAGWVRTLASARPALVRLSLATTQAEFDAGMGGVAEAVGPQLAQLLLDSLLGSSSIGGVQLNIGNLIYSVGPKTGSEDVVPKTGSEDVVPKTGAEAAAESELEGSAPPAP